MFPLLLEQSTYYEKKTTSDALHKDERKDKGMLIGNYWEGLGQLQTFQHLSSRVSLNVLVDIERSQDSLMG